jgi:hypothetical protein
MKIVFLSAILTGVLVSGCDTTSDVVELSDEEIVLFSGAGIDPTSALQILRFGDSVEQLQGLDENWENYGAEGVVLLTQANQGQPTLQSLRAVLDDSRYSAYLLEQGFGYGPDSIAILANTDPWFYLKTVKINGVNYDIEHDEVIRRLKEWDALYGLQLIGAGMDWLHAEFEKPPKNWASFADEVYELCPDVVDQGTGSIEALAVELKKMGGVYLWWD